MKIGYVGSIASIQVVAALRLLPLRVSVNIWTMLARAGQGIASSSGR